MYFDIIEAIKNELISQGIEEQIFINYDNRTTTPAMALLFQSCTRQQNDEKEIMTCLVGFREKRSELGNLSRQVINFLTDIKELIGANYRIFYVLLDNELRLNQLNEKGECELFIEIKIFFEETTSTI